MPEHGTGGFPDILKNRFPPPVGLVGGIAGGVVGVMGGIVGTYLSIKSTKDPKERN